MGGDEPRDAAAHRRPDEGAGSHTVLVVDDEPDVRDWISGALERAGVAAYAASTGPEALRLVAHGTVRPTVLLTDIEMPGMSGIELAARVLAIRPRTRVVMMTGDPAHAASARDRTTIVATVLIKPLDEVALLDAVRPDAAAPVP
ncbi:MAG TPA: response regulator [Candidatus Limnocylindrales bacterium]|jgi:CheY-like chemotaxis protein